MPKGQEWLRELEFTPNGQLYSVPNQPLKGRAVTVIGGGPSLRRSVVEAVKPYPIICANNSFYLMSEPTVVVALDRRWYNWHGGPVQSMGHFPVTSLRPGTSIPYHGPHAVLKKDREPTWPPDNETLTGDNSGHAAIALAFILGARAVYLIGFDMDFRGDQQENTHWHEPHPVPPSHANYVSRFRPKLEKMAKMAQDKGLFIASITETTANIPRVTLEDALKDLGHENSVDHPPPPASVSQ